MEEVELVVVVLLAPEVESLVLGTVGVVVVAVSFDERVVGATIGSSSCRRSRRAVPVELVVVAFETCLYTRGIQGLSSMKYFSTIERIPRKYASHPENEEGFTCSDVMFELVPEYSIPKQLIEFPSQSTMGGFGFAR